jgi:acetate kinase
MKILVLNCGSSSIRYRLFEMPGGSVLAWGLVQRIGNSSSEINHCAAGKRLSRSLPVADHAAGLQIVVDMLSKGGAAALEHAGEIEAVGHRVVHGGEKFTQTVLIDDEVMEAIEDHVELAPLHNPPNLAGIRVAQDLLPGVPQVAVFDTAFHQSIPRHAYLYALPMDLYRKERIRRYGFHGTSHRYVSMRAAEILKKGPEDANLITCHLGNGASITAVAAGRSVDTSMGFTPLEGLVMGTRCGDIDPAIALHLAQVRKMSPAEIDNLLNKKSGLLGLSGRSNDVRELLRLMERGHQDAATALEIFCYRIHKYIGAYLAVLNRADALVFTAGIGENSPWVRRNACKGLERFGIRIDEIRNKAAVGCESDISADGAEIRVLVVPTNEEKLIAMDAYALTQPQYG